VVFIQVFIRKNKFNTASNWSLYRSGHAHLAIKKKKMAEARKEYMSETASQPPLNSIELNRLYFSNWCMVTESIMKWVFWYLSYIKSSYKHWKVECVGDNHPLIALNKIGCIFTLVYGYWKFHGMGVLIFILHYLRQPPLHIAFIGCILHIS
jgi:hypothetical protein